VLADRPTPANRQAVRRCRSYRLSRRPIEPSNLFPVGRGAELRCDRRRAGAPHRSGSPARPAQRWMCCRRLGCATPTTRGLVGPIARHDRSPPPKTKAKVSCRSPSNRSRIGITGAVDRRDHRRPRCRDRPSKRARPAGGTTASALPPARAALSQCHGCSSRVKREVVTVDDRRIVRPAQPVGADIRPLARSAPGSPTRDQWERSLRLARAWVAMRRRKRFRERSQFRRSSSDSFAARCPSP
jgi:hypothetical protein